MLGFTHTAGLITLNALQIKKTLNKDGTYTEEEILPLNFSFDHRFFDGAVMAKMKKEVLVYIKLATYLVRESR
jgi:hypothetical protein